MEVFKIDFKQLTYFKTIVDAGNISKAAEILYMAQPPLSQMLKQFEEEMGAVLIYRHTRGWELTDAGYILYQHAVHVLQRTVDVKTEINELDAGVRGELSIGISSTCISMLPGTIKAFRDAYPDVYIKIWKGDSSYLEELLHNGTIEIAFMVLPMELTGYRFHLLPKEPFVVAIPKMWRELANEQYVELERITDYPFLMLAPMEGYSVYENIVRHFEKNHLSPNIVMECKDISTLLALVSSGIGISIIPKSEISEVHKHAIDILEMEDFSLTVEPSLLWLKDHQLSKVAEHFLSSVCDTESTGH